MALGKGLVDLEQRDAEIALAQAEAALAKAESQLANLRAGKRPQEIAVIEAALASAKAQAAEATRNADQLLDLSNRGVATETQRDDAATAHVAEIKANLAVARLPARKGEIAAATTTLGEAEAARDHAKWQIDQRKLASPAPGLVTDILLRPGEIAAVGQPILSLLPDGAVKLRLYLPEAALASVAPGSLLQVHCNRCPDGLTARVSYVSDSPEFTPPVIYSVDSRQKLVYLVEARPLQETSLKPGQIFDVDLAEAKQ